MVQDYTALAELVAYIIGPSSAAARALAHAAIVKAQGGPANIFYVDGYWIVQIAECPSGRFPSHSNHLVRAS
jgi:hypothetical protein